MQISVNYLTCHGIPNKHGGRKVGGVMVKFKSVLLSCYEKTAHLTISDPDLDIFPLPKLEHDVYFVVLETAVKSS